MYNCISIPRMFSNPENWSWTPGPPNEGWNSIHNSIGSSGVSQYSMAKYHNCYHSLNRFLRQHLFGWIAVMLSRLVISALYGNVMSDLGVRERPGWGDRIPGQTRDSVSVRPRTQQQHSTPINNTTAFGDGQMGVLYILFKRFLLILLK